MKAASVRFRLMTKSDLPILLEWLRRPHLAQWREGCASLDELRGYRCDPFTITDAHSRFLIRCQAVARMDLAQVSAVCDAAMREYGVPERIRTAKPPARTVTAQQKKFDRFRSTFNYERPHEALANETPGSIYVPSTRLLPSRVASFQYPRSFQTRRVNNSGDISWHKGRVFVSEVLRNEEIGFEQIDEDVHRVFFHHTKLGEFNSAEMRFRPALRS
jgi:hypothetical protein